MQEWKYECEKKVNKQKGGKYIFKSDVKIWSDLNNRLAVAQNKKIVKYEK